MGCSPGAGLIAVGSAAFSLLGSPYPPGGKGGSTQQRPPMPTLFLNCCVRLRLVEAVLRRTAGAASLVNSCAI